MKKEIRVNLATVVLVLAVYFTLNVIPYLEIVRPLSDVVYQVVINSLLTIIGILEIVVFVKSGRARVYGHFRFRWSYLGAVLLAFFLFYVWVILQNILFPVAQNVLVSEENSVGLTGLAYVFLMFIYPVIIGPLVEEFLCRGLVMTSLYPYRRFGLDVLVSASVFSLGHILQFGWVLTDFITYLGSGFILGGLFRYTRSLAWPLAAHILWNTFLLVVGLLVFGY